MDGMVKRVAVAVLLLAVVCVAACGDEPHRPKWATGSWTMNREQGTLIGEDWRGSKHDNQNDDAEYALGQLKERVDEALRSLPREVLTLHQDGRAPLTGVSKGAVARRGNWTASGGLVTIRWTPADVPAEPGRPGNAPWTLSRNGEALVQTTGLFSIQYERCAAVPR